MSEMVAVRLDLIDEGRALLEVNNAISQVGSAVIENYDNHNDLRIAKGKVTVEIDINKDEKTSGYEVSYVVKTKRPARPRRFTRVEQKGLRLVCDERAGSTGGNPNQKSMDFIERVDGNPENDNN